MRVRYRFLLRAAFATNPNAEKILRHFGSSPAVALYGGPLAARIRLSLTLNSERELTVEIVAGDNIGFSDTVDYEAVAVRDGLVVLSWQEHIGSTIVHVLDSFPVKHTRQSHQIRGLNVGKLISSTWQMGMGNSVWEAILNSCSTLGFVAPCWKETLRAEIGEITTAVSGPPWLVIRLRWKAAKSSRFPRPSSRLVLICRAMPDRPAKRCR